MIPDFRRFRSMILATQGKKEEAISELAVVKDRLSPETYQQLVELVDIFLDIEVLFAKVYEPGTLNEVTSLADKVAKLLFFRKHSDEFRQFAILQHNQPIYSSISKFMNAHNPYNLVQLRVLGNAKPFIKGLDAAYEDHPETLYRVMKGMALMVDKAKYHDCAVAFEEGLHGLTFIPSLKREAAYGAAMMFFASAARQSGPPQDVEKRDRGHEILA